MAKRPVHDVLKENFRAVKDRTGAEQRMSLAAWAKSKGIPQRDAQRVYQGVGGRTLSTLEELAGALGFEPWQLIYPGLKPDAPPRLPTLSPLALDLANSFDKLPDGDEKRKLYILIVGMIVLRPPLAVAPPPAEPETPAPSPAPTARQKQGR